MYDDTVCNTDRELVSHNKGLFKYLKFTFNSVQLINSIITTLDFVSLIMTDLTVPMEPLTSPKETSMFLQSITLHPILMINSC